MKFSIITTCKGRLHYLVKALPSFIIQQDAEVIVVDYSCPQGTTEVVSREFPGVKVVSVPDRSGFNPSEARNLGAREAQGDVLVFVDSDIVLAENFTQGLGGLPENCYGEFVGPNDIRGTCVVPSDAFRLVGGYDEVMFGYAGEDLDLYARLLHAGLNRDACNINLIKDILPNTDVERVIYHDVGRKFSFARGKAYRELKMILLRIAAVPELNLDLRRQMWDNIDSLIKSPDIFTQDHFIDIPIPSLESDGMLKGSKFAMSLRMAIRLQK